MISFWNPAKLENKDELDRRVILGIAKEKLIKDLEKVNKKIEKSTEEMINNINISKKRRVSMNIRRDSLAKEKEDIMRRLDIINEML